MIDADVVFDNWTLAEDEVWERSAARVIVVDPTARVLLLRGVDPADPANTWWFTPGGGIEAGESERDAAAREVFEESGLSIGQDDLIGPVATRVAEFRYFGRRCRQHEVLFFAEVAGAEVVRTDGWTDVERASVTDVRWHELADLVAPAVVPSVAPFANPDRAPAAEPVYPQALPSLVQSLLADGWDGLMRTID